MIKNDGISATTVSFVSGRGSVGKTSIIISLAMFLSSLGEKKAVFLGITVFCLSIVTWFFSKNISDIRELRENSEEDIFYLKAKQRKYGVLKKTM